jgi:glutathione peroxidase
MSGVILAPCRGAEEEEAVPSIYEIPVQTIDGKETTLAEHRGKVLLIVNVASKCGFTGQYAGLQKLYERFKEKGLVVLGFPANDFLRQEPGTNDEIKQFCSLEFGVTFPMFAKITVKGEAMHPLYHFLTEPATNPDSPGAISWNFNKFLIGRDGRVAARFGSRTKPLSKDLVAAVEKALEAGEAARD